MNNFEKNKAEAVECSKLIKFLNNETFTTIEKLEDVLGLRRRAVQISVQKLRKYIVVISSSTDRGYRLLKPLKKGEYKTIRDELAVVNRFINEVEARIESLRDILRAPIAYKKRAEKLLEEETNEEK